MEQVTLAAPETPPTNTRWIVQEVRLAQGVRYAGDGTIEVDALLSQIYVHLVGDHGQVLDHTWNGQPAHNLLVALNKANLTIKSLHKRVMEQLITDGVIAGSITGTPD